MQELTIKQKLINYYYFVIFNSILACIIGVGYWLRGPSYPGIPTPKLAEWLDLLYVVTSHFSIMTIGVFIVSLAILPTIFLKTKKAIFIQFILFNLLLATLVCDVKFFQYDAIHLFVEPINNFKDIITSIEALFTINKIIVYIVITICASLLYKIIKSISETNYFSKNNIGTKFSILLLTSSIISLLIYHSPTKEKYQIILPHMQYLFIDNHKNHNITNAYNIIKHGELKYPLKPLKTTEVTNPPNILIIAMDAWRADCFNEKDSPNLWKFAKQGTVFTNHFSGGNNTYDGLFSLFYGISPNYYNRFKHQKIPTLLFSQLNRLDYQINFFNGWPEEENKKYMKLIFDYIPNLYITSKGISRAKKDKNLTNNWLNWYINLDKTKPWFSFIFYDSLHGPDFPHDYSDLYKPVKSTHYKAFADIVGRQDFINIYKTSVHYVDSLANQILTHLKQSNDLDNTIVIITADHGCEWNDNNQDTWGYSTNFTNCQIQVPFAIIAPKLYNDILVNKVHNITTHYDFIPTLMKNFLGIQNEITDYSIGADLLSSNTSTNCHLVIHGGRYRYFSTDFTVGCIKNNEILTFNNKKIYFIDKFNQWIFNKNININCLNQALENITRFIKK